jgi:hypothetical protein
MESRIEKILEKIQTQLPKYLTRLITTIEKDASSSEALVAVENIRKLLLPILIKPNYKNLPLAYNILIEIAEKYPINNIDPFSQEIISSEKRMVISTGHVFDIEKLLEYFQSTSKPINVLTNKEFNIFDTIEIVCHLYKFQKNNQEAILEEESLYNLFKHFSKLIEKNDIFLLKFFLDKAKNSDDLLKQFCSFGLCHIAQYYFDKIELFDLFYKNGQFHPDHIHNFAKIISSKTWVYIYENSGKKSSPLFESMPLLGIASRAGNYEVAKYILQLGANVNPYITKEGIFGAPLFDVIKGEKLKPNPVTNYGYGNVVKLLLKHGANIDLTINGISAKELASPNFLKKLNYYFEYIVFTSHTTNIFSPQSQSEIQNCNQPQYSITAHLLSFSSLWSRPRANNGNLVEEDIPETLVQNN